MNGPGGGGFVPLALCVNLNLLVCLVAKLCGSSREGPVWRKQVGAHCWSPTGFVPNFLRQERNCASLRRFHNTHTHTQLTKKTQTRKQTHKKKPRKKGGGGQRWSNK